MKTMLIGIAALALTTSSALAMGTTPTTAPTPTPTREAVAEYDAIAALLTDATKAMQPSSATVAERNAARPAFVKLQAAVEAAYKATAPFNKAAFDKQAGAARTYHAQACSALPGC